MKALLTFIILVFLFLSVGFVTWDFLWITEIVIWSNADRLGLLMIIAVIVLAIHGVGDFIIFEIKRFCK